MAVTQHNTPDPSSARRRKRPVPLHKIRFQPLDLPQPPSNSAWTAKALEELAMIRTAFVIGKDDSDAMFARWRESDGDGWGCLMEFAVCFQNLAAGLRDRAGVYEQIAARLNATLERAAYEQPGAIEMIEMAAKVSLGREGEPAQP